MCNEKLHVAYTQDKRNAYIFSVRKLFGRNTPKQQDSNKCDLKQTGREVVDGLIWLRTGEFAGCCKDGHEPSGSMKCREKLSAYQQDSDVEPLGRLCTITDPPPPPPVSI
jgi:hypothetical protein